MELGGGRRCAVLFGQFKNGEKMFIPIWLLVACGTLLRGVSICPEQK